MKKFALIVAGGSGKRIGGKIPKQFEVLQGRPVLIHTFQVFYNYDPEINFVLVLPKNQTEYWKTLCEKYKFNLKYDLVTGGETRFHSVKNGLKHIPKNTIVFIHDGVRPLVTESTIDNCYRTALKKGNALPVIPFTESLRQLEDKNNISVDRSKYFLVQTPQTFQSDKIKNAYNQSNTGFFTDDASVLESIGEKIHLVKGNYGNIKITFPQDLIIANALLKNKTLA